MGSVTSCFNSAMYRKTMLRFWPLWALYGLFWLFALPLNMVTRYFDQIRWGAEVAEAQRWLLGLAQDVPRFLSVGVWMALFFGVLAAMACFGYLYNNRSACMLHALPMRRESLFASQYLAGLSFLLLPQLAAAVLALVVEMLLLPATLWGAALPLLGVWLLAQSALSLFFFSFAAFCAMFTGHILALPAFYGILNVLVISVSTLVSTLMGQFLYGLSTRYYSNPLVEFCTPAYFLSQACDWSPETGLSSSAALGAYAAAGMVFALLALMVYRWRHIESAGDVVAIPLVRPLFQCGVSFCSGLFLGTFTSIFFGWIDGPLALTLNVLFWAVVGWFVAEMLLRKSFRVLRAWRGALAMAGVLALLCAACVFDWFGVENRVPDAGDVATLSVSGDFGYPYDSGGLSLSPLTDPAQIQQFIDLHQAVVRDKGQLDYSSPSYSPGDNYISLSLFYTLKSGATLTRDYHGIPVRKDQLGQEGSVTYLVNQLLQDRALVAQSYDFDGYEDGRLVEAYLFNVYNQEEDYEDTLYLEGYAQALWDAVRKDYAEGTIGVRYLFDDQDRRNNTYVTDLSFTWEKTAPENGHTYDVSLSITLTPQARHVAQVLEQTGALGGAYTLLPHTPFSGYGEEFPQTQEAYPAAEAVPY